MQMISMGKMAHILNIEKKQLRHWAREFNINNLANQSENQIRQACFSQADLVTFKLIKKLIFQENYTPEQVKNYFSAATEPASQLVSPGDNIEAQSVLASDSERSTTFNILENQAEDHPLNEIFAKPEQISMTPALKIQLLDLHKKLIQLRQLL